MKSDNTVLYHFTKISRDKFQIYNLVKKEGSLVNTKELGDFLSNIRGGKAMDSSFYKRLISLPNCHTIGITASALEITKSASHNTVEPWKLVNVDGQEVFVSVKTGCEAEEDDEDTIKAKASLNKVTHHYKVALKTGDVIRRHAAYEIIANEMGLGTENFYMNPSDMSGMLIVDIDSEDNPQKVIEALISLLNDKDFKMQKEDCECNHDFCDCGQELVGPIVPDAEEDDFILVAPDEKPVIAKKLETLKKMASDKKHYKIYAYDKVVYDFDEELEKAREEANKVAPEKSFFDKEEIETEADINDTIYQSDDGQVKTVKELGMENSTIDQSQEPEEITTQDGVSYKKKTISSLLPELFKEDYSIQADKDVKDLMKCAYYSNKFDKVAFMGPEQFIFSDKDKMYMLDNDTASCSTLESLSSCAEKEEKSEEDDLVNMVDEDLK